MQVDADPDALQTLTQMGFNKESAVKALQQCGNKQAKAIDTLVSWGQSATASANAAEVKDDSSGRAVPKEPASHDVNSSSQSVNAASLLAQALQSGTSGQPLPYRDSKTPPSYVLGESCIIG